MKICQSLLSQIVHYWCQQLICGFQLGNAVPFKPYHKLVLRGSIFEEWTKKDYNKEYDEAQKICENWTNSKYKRTRKHINSENSISDKPDIEFFNDFQTERKRGMKWARKIKIEICQQMPRRKRQLLNIFDYLQKKLIWEIAEQDNLHHKEWNDSL